MEWRIFDSCVVGLQSGIQWTLTRPANSIREWGAGDTTVPVIKPQHEKSVRPGLIAQAGLGLARSPGGVYQDLPVDLLDCKRLPNVKLTTSNYPCQQSSASDDFLSQSGPDFFQVAARLTFHSNLELGFTGKNGISRFQIVQCQHFGGDVLFHRANWNSQQTERFDVHEEDLSQSAGPGVSVAIKPVISEGQDRLDRLHWHPASGRVVECHDSWCGFAQQHASSYNVFYSC